MGYVRLIATLALYAALSSCSNIDPLEEGPSFPTPTRGMVISEHPLATYAGLRVLEIGGNAADAAVATALALAVVYPQAGNLGGGGFALWVPHVGDPRCYDFRETAPSQVTPELYLKEDGTVDPERSLHTPLAVGVPGSPAGLYELYRLHGSRSVSFAQLCAPAIALAEEGFRVDPWLARALRDPSQREKLERWDATRALFYPDGEPLAEGELFRQLDLGRTLRLYSRAGPAGIYRGGVAREIVNALAEADFRTDFISQGAAMNVGDLAGYEVKEREPVIGWFRGSQVIGAGPPCSGGIVLLQILSILDGFPLDAERQATLSGRALQPELGGDPSGISSRALHWWIEAMRRAFADRAEHLGDPDYYPVPVDELLAPEWIARRRVSIGERADPNVGPRVFAQRLESSETTHVSVIDRLGNAVSLTTTLNDTFGSGILVPGAGFLLNNELDDFSIQAGTPNLFGLVGSEANQLAAGKRPLSSMCPTVVREGGRQVTFVLGAPGGPRIISAVAQVLLRVMVYGQDLESAVRAPRLHQQWKPQATRVQAEWAPGLLEALVNRHGQVLEMREAEHFGRVQAIWVGPEGEPVGASDPRSGGVAGAEGQPVPAARRPGDVYRIAD